MKGGGGERDEGRERERRGGGKSGISRFYR